MSVDALPRTVDRYRIHEPIASGGMATVHFGRLVGAAGFSRVVAIKRLHENYAHDPAFVRMFLAEARLAARVKHPNVVSTLDVIATEGEVFLVMEYVLGESLSKLLRIAEERPIPLPIVVAIACGLLEGLQSAHEATNEHGEPLRIVHRDVSPQNVLLGADGVARVFDFGIAKAADAAEQTREGVIKGKVSYMAPEQVHGGDLDPRADVFSAGIVLWELLVGRRRHAGSPSAQVFLKLARGELEPPPPPSTIRPEVPKALDAIVARAIEVDRDRRWPSARAMALALEDAVRPATPREVASWLHEVARDGLERSAAIVRRLERDDDGADPRPSSASRITAAGSVPGGIVLGTGGGTGASAASTVPPRTRAESVPVLAPRGRSGVAYALAAAAVVALAAVTVLGRSARAPTVGANGTADSATAPTNVPAASATTPAPELVATSTGSAESALPSAAASTSAPRPSEPAPPKSEAKPHRSSRPVVTATAAKAAKGGCESPFTIGPDGIRRVKPECM